MKLADLNPRFVSAVIDAKGQRLIAKHDAIYGAQGIRFDCPCGTGHILIVWFANPLGVPVAPRDFDQTPHRWQRSGETYANLSLSPSVNAGCWHGFVRNGEIT